MSEDNKELSFEEMKEVKRRQQEADRKALAEGKIKQEDLSLFKGFDRSKVKIIKSDY